jgi:hypothetical protein
MLDVGRLLRPDVIKFTITTTIPRNFCERGKRTKEYLNKTNEIA